MSAISSSIANASEREWGARLSFAQWENAVFSASLDSPSVIALGGMSPTATIFNARGVADANGERKGQQAFGGTLGLRAASASAELAWTGSIAVGGWTIRTARDI